MQFNPTTNEPFFRLPPPYAHIIFTPPRHSDGAAEIAAMNHPAIYHNVIAPPLPYTAEDWEYWYNLVAGETARSLELYNEIKDPEDPRKWAGVGCPCLAIREERTGLFLGELAVRLRGYTDITDLDERDKMAERNASYLDGDPRKEVEVGFFIVPEAHGKGIMPAALMTLIREWLVPYCNVAVVHGDYFVRNLGSKRVFEKCGFAFEKIVVGSEELNDRVGRRTGKMGVKVETGCTVWRREDRNAE